MILATEFWYQKTQDSRLDYFEMQNFAAHFFGEKQFWTIPCVRHRAWWCRHRVCGLRFGRGRASLLSELGLCPRYPPCSSDVSPEKSTILACSHQSEFGNSGEKVDMDDIVARYKISTNGHSFKAILDIVYTGEFGETFRFTIVCCDTWPKQENDRNEDKEQRWLI